MSTRKHAALAKQLNEIAGGLVRELFDSYHGAILRHVDPAGRALTEASFRYIYEAALLRVAASLSIEAGMDEEQFLGLASESRRQELSQRGLMDGSFNAL
jgi:hypothetical protein